MSHNVETMFSVKLMPWHRLGVILNDPPTSEEAIIAAGLDWPVYTKPIYVETEYVENNEKHKKFVKLNNRVALMRRIKVKKDNGSIDEIETPLSFVSNRYQPLQNVEAFKIFDPFIKSGILSYETAGSLNNGQKIWILAKMNKSFNVGDNDEIKQYVLLCNGHDGVTGVSLYPTGIRVVCQNTLALSSADAELGITIRHCGNIISALEKARDALFEIDNRFVISKQIFDAMHKRIMSEEEKENYLSRLIPDVNENMSERVKLSVKTQRNRISDLLYNGKNTELSNYDPRTAWALYNAAVEFADYYMGARAKDRAQYHLFGAGRAFKARAFQEILTFLTN